MPITQQNITPPPPVPVLRTVFEGESARALHSILFHTVTIPEAPRKYGYTVLADEFYTLANQYFAAVRARMEKV